MTTSASTAAMLLLLSMGAPLLARQAIASRSEVEAVAGSNAALETQSELLAAKIRNHRDHAAELDAELATQRSVTPRLLALFPSPELATPERLLELAQDSSERTGVRFRHCTAKAFVRPEVWIGEFREIDISLPCYGTLDKLVRFLEALERNPTFVQVTGFQLSAGDKRPDDGLVSCWFTIRTFRFDERRRPWIGRRLGSSPP